MKYWLKLFTSFCVCVAIITWSGSATAFVTSITIGTGSAKGVYFPAGKAICKQVNRDTTTNQITCSAKKSAGSLSNLVALQNFKVDLAACRIINYEPFFCAANMVLSC